MQKKSLLVLLGMLLLSSTVVAFELKELYYPIRANAMGGAFTAIANDENAIWTNPAGVARIRKARSRGLVHAVKVPNLVFGANSTSRSFIKGISQSGNEANAESVSELSPEAVDQPLWAGLGMAPLVMFEAGTNPSALSIYTATTLKALISSEDTSTARTEAISDVGALYNITFTSPNNQANFGINLRYLARYAYEDYIPVEELAVAKTLQTRIKTNSNKSMAVGLDLGAMYTFSDFWFPTIAMSIYNLPTGCRENYLNPYSKTRQTVCGTKFSGDFGNEEALSTIDPMDARVGFSITPRLSKSFAARIALDFHHLAFASGAKNFGLSDVPLEKLAHVGVQFFTGNPLLPPEFSVSFGLNQGYYSMGASVRLGQLSLDFASIGRDISPTTKAVEDRRILGGLSLSW